MSDSWARSLQKKVRQIDDLKAQQRAGKRLDAAQSLKVEREASLRKQLEEAITVLLNQLSPGDSLLVDGRQARLKKRNERSGKLRVCNRL